MYLGLSYVLTLRKATMLIAFSGDSLEKLEERKIRLDMNIWRKKNKTHKLVVVVYVLSSSCQYLRVCVHSCLSVLNNFRVCPWWNFLEKIIKNLSYLWIQENLCTTTIFFCLHWVAYLANSEVLVISSSINLLFLKSACLSSST